jgi:hypothetical protein
MSLQSAALALRFEIQEDRQQNRKDQHWNPPTSGGWPPGPKFPSRIASHTASVTSNAKQKPGHQCGTPVFSMKK